MDVLAGLAPLSPFVDPVAERFTGAGYRIFLVGGVVRDLALGSVSAPVDDTANDIDLTTDAHPDEIKRLLSPLAEALWSQGEKFGTIGATIKGQALEITTHRAEAYDPTSRMPVVTFGTDLREDLSRRDFTMNAMAIELPSQILHDPFNGLADLEARELRTPLSPEVSFGDDPLRMLRAARFISRFLLTAVPDLLEAAANYADRLKIVSVERVAEELDRLLKVKEPAAGLAFYSQAGLIDHVIQPYAMLGDDRRSLGMRLAGSQASPFLRRLGLFWPLTVDTADEMRRLRYAKQEALRMGRILATTRRFLQADSGPADVRRFVARANIEDLQLVNDLAVLVAEHDSQLAIDQAERVTTLIGDVSASEDLGDLASPLTATEIMEVLDIKPGPLVGRALRFLETSRLDHGPIARTDAKEMLLAWMDQKQRSS